MSNYRIRYTQQAIDDMDAVFDYIMTDNQNAALDMLAAFDQSISRLTHSPFIGAAIRTDEPMLIAPGYRYLVVAPYLIFYRVDENEVHIGRILHSRQDWLQLLFGIR